MIKENEILIEPISTWLDGETKSLTIIRFNYYSQYDFNGNAGHVNYSLCEEIIKEDITYYASIINGSINLPWSVVENWGQDDTPIFDYVLQQLQLTRA